MENSKEIWRDVTDYEGYYQVSSLGMVRSCDRYVSNGKGDRLTKGRLLTLRNNGKGYLYVDLYRNNKGTRLYVHRLVARAFQDIVGECKAELEIDHRDTNPSNNRADNLRYCTRKENMNNPITKERIKGENATWYGKFGKDNPSSLPIVQYDIKGNFVAEFEGLSDAGRQLGIRASEICAVLKHRRKNTHGYIFRYKEQSKN